MMTAPGKEPNETAVIKDGFNSTQLFKGIRDPSRLHRARPSPRAANLAAVLLCIHMAGCTTVDQPSVASWREAVGAAKQQSATTFEAVKALVRESELDRIEQSKPTELRNLKEEDVAAALPPAAVRKWNTALDNLAAYAAAIEALLSPDLPKGVGESLQRTGEQIGATANVDLLKADKDLSKAIGSLGQQIVATAASHEARSVMLATDAAVKDVTSKMADMLYRAVAKKDSNGKPVLDDQGHALVIESGVLPTVKVTWDDKLERAKLPFGRTEDGPTRRKIAEQYADLLDQRTALEESILSLRQAILDLGAAHTAAAQGRSPDLRALIAIMREDTQTAKGIVESIKKPAK